MCPYLKLIYGKNILKIRFILSGCIIKYACFAFLTDKVQGLECKVYDPPITKLSKPLNFLNALMAASNANNTLKRLQNRYRLVVVNEDINEQVVSFKLSRLSVYIALSTLFVVLVGLTVALIAFTPLKLYIPGFGDAKQAKEYQYLKVRADSIEKNLIYKQQYIDNIEKILKGDLVKKDTTPLKLNTREKSND